MALATPSLAAPGDLDATFSQDGKVSLISAGPFVARAVAVQDDGRIVVAGYSCAPGPSEGGTCQADGDSSVRLARFTADGGLDPEFGSAGLVTTQLGTARSQAFDLVLQPDGRVVVGGVARNQRGRDTFALARYDSRGALDPAFGDHGVTLTEVGTGFAAIADLTVAPDGGIIAVGQARDADGRERMAIGRYTRDGRLESSFGPFGTVMAGSGPYAFGLGSATGPDGGVVVAGITATDAIDPGTYRVGLARLTASGQPDTSFAADGDSEFAVGPGSSFANALVGLPDGRWLAAGAGTDEAGRQVMALLRGRADGTLDGAWDGDGIAAVHVGQGALANDVLLIPDGRALVVGQANTPAGYSFAVARMSADGLLDAGFGTGGVTLTPWTRFAVARATAGALDAAGRLVVAGVGCMDGEGANCRRGKVYLALARYLGGDPPPPPPPPPAPDTTPPTGNVSGAPARVRRSRLVRRGLRLRITPSEPTEVRVRLLRRGRTLVRRALPHGEGVRTVLVRPRRRALPARRRFAVRLRILLVDAAGNTATLRKRVRVR